MWNDLRQHLTDNGGNANMTRMIWFCIAGLVGGILTALIVGIKSPVTTWLVAAFDSWFSDGHGKFVV